MLESISNGESVKQTLGRVGHLAMFGNQNQVQVTLILGTRGGSGDKDKAWQPSGGGRTGYSAQAFVFNVI